MGNNWDITDLRNKVKKSGIVGSLPVGMKFDVQQGKDFKRNLSHIKIRWLLSKFFTRTTIS